MQRFIRTIQGFLLVLFVWIAAEIVPYPPNLEAVPSFFTLRILLDIYPAIVSVQTVWFMPIALVCFLVALWPVVNRSIDWGSALLVVVGLIGIPLFVYFRNEAWASYFWSFHLAIFIGVNLWVRQLDYLYAGLLTGSFFDFISAYQALRQGLSTVPQFYTPEMSTSAVMLIDGVVFFVVLILWIGKIGKKKPQAAQNLGSSERVVWQSQDSSSSS